ncbi:hypothetical protein [Anaeroarcus burkinensis]|uniref:hypothetical protein n=1 Tax=Anaeroarcus burkinensis TaxID=82376 RepID=UPI00041DEB1C|nr:hypothetical protein [Anaeroarcus burkinensis]
MAGNSYDFSNARIDNKQGSFGVGENISNSNAVSSGAEELVAKLLHQIGSLPIAEIKKSELIEAVKSTDEQMKAERPNKFALRSMISAFESAIKTITMTPELIRTVDLWKQQVEVLLA